MYPYSYGDNLTPDQARSNIIDALKKTIIYTGVFCLGVGMAVAKETITKSSPSPGAPGVPANGVVPAAAPVGKKAAETAALGVVTSIAIKTCENPKTIGMAIMCGFVVGFVLGRPVPSAIYD